MWGGPSGSTENAGKEREPIKGVSLTCSCGQRVIELAVIGKRLANRAIPPRRSGGWDEVTPVGQHWPEAQRDADAGPQKEGGNVLAPGNRVSTTPAGLSVLIGISGVGTEYPPHRVEARSELMCVTGQGTLGDTSRLLGKH